MPLLRLKNTGPVVLGGKRPGEEFTVKCDDDGVPLDIYWRRRLADEVRYGCGAIAKVVVPQQVLPPLPSPTLPEIVPAFPLENPAPAPVASSSRKKG